MAMRMLIDATHPEETRVVVLRGNRLEEFDFESATKKQLKGNIYLAKVTRVEPSLQAAFVEYGGNRHGFLAFSEIHPDYYQIPVADRQALIDEEEEAAARERAEEDEADESSEDGRPVEHGNVIEVMTDSAEDEGAVTDVLAEDGEDEPSPDAPSLAADAEFDEPTLEGDPETLEVVADSAAVSSEAPVREDDADGAAVVEVDSTVEEIGDTEADIEEEVASSRPSRRPRRSYKIQEVIKRRQIMLVQVVKEERGNKGAALTTYLSLAGRYCVLMPNSPRGGGISRKIQNPADRKRLKAITSELEMPKGMSVIVRTAGLNRTKPEIKRDYEYLVRMWDSVRTLTLESSAPALVYEEGNLIKRAIRDLYTKDIEEILVEGEEGYREAKDFMRMLIPSHAKNVQLYKERVPLFQRFQVETLLDQMFSPTVQLRSGGYVVINPTEALVSIDVNSGRATREHNIEETATKTNLEAAEEIARQLRLRDLAGLIVIDFIDMEDQRNARAVERKLKDCLKNDRARIQIGRISPFGLLEMSRQRLRPGVLEASTLVCPHCRGAGVVRSTESSALHVLRAIEEEGMRERSSKVVVAVPSVIALYLLNQKRETLRSIEERYDFKVYVEVDEQLIAPDHRIERLAGRTAPLPPVSAAVRSGMVHMEPDAEGADDEDDEVPEVADVSDVSEVSEVAAETRADRSDKPHGGRRRRRRRASDRDDTGSTTAPSDGHPQAAGAAQEADDSADAVAAGAEAEDGAPPGDGSDGDDQSGERRGRRRRGRRGGRRRRSDEAVAPGDDAVAAGTESGAPAEAGDMAPDPSTGDGAEASPAAVAVEAEIAPMPPAENTAWPQWPGDAASPPEAQADPADDAEPALAFPEAPSPEAAGSEDAPPSPEAVAVAAEPEADKPRGPARRGWWQRRFGA